MQILVKSLMIMIVGLLTSSPQQKNLNKDNMVKYRVFDLYQKSTVSPTGWFGSLRYKYTYGYGDGYTGFDKHKFREDIASFCSTVDVISITPEETGKDGVFIVWYREKPKYHG